MPVIPRLNVSIILALLIYFAGGLIVGVDPRAFGANIVFFCIVWALCLVLLSFLLSVKISISPKLLIDATRKPTLKVRGVTRKDDLAYIPLHNIQKISCQDYEVPWYYVFLGPFSPSGSRQDQKIVLPGWKGKAAVVTYLRETVMDSSPQQVTLIFPTQRFEDLRPCLQQEGSMSSDA